MPWNIHADIEYVLASAADGTRVLTPVCQLVYKALVEKNIPDIDIQFHKRSQMFKTVEAALLQTNNINKKSKVHSTILDIKCEHNAGCFIVKLLAALSPAGRTYPGVLPNHYRTSIQHCLFCSEPIER